MQTMRQISPEAVISGGRRAAQRWLQVHDRGGCPEWMHGMRVA